MSSLAEHFRAMARNNAWANHRLLNACAKLSEEEYRARRVNFFPSVELTPNHILAVEWYYLDALDNGGTLGASCTRCATCSARASTISGASRGSPTAG